MANLRAQLAAIEEALIAERTCNEHLERDIAAEARKRQHLLYKRQKTSETASRQLAENEDSLQEFQSKVSTMRA